MEKALMLRRAAMIGAGLVTAILLVLGGVYGVAQTDFGRGVLARQIESALSDQTMTVRLAALDGNVFGNFSVGEISAENAAGGTLTVTGLQVSWHPLALVRGMVDVESVDIQGIADSGFFDGDAAPAEEGSDGSMAVGVSVRLAALRVVDIDLGSATFGERIRLALNGALEMDSDLSELLVDLNLVRTDGGAGRADINLEYRARPARFSLQARIDEPGGGLITRLAGLPDGTPLSIELGGEGPPDKWIGQLVAAAGTLANIRTELTVAVAGSGATVSINGVSEFQQLLQEPLRPLAGPPLTFRADLAFQPGEAVTVSGLTAENGAVTIQGNGGYRFAGNTIDGTVGVAVLPRPGVALEFEGASAGALQLDATVSGTIERPVLAAKLGAREIAYDGAKIATLAGEVAVALLEKDSSSAKAVLTLEGLDAAGMVPPALLGDSLAVQVDSLILNDGSIPYLGATLTAASGATVSVDAVRQQDGALDGTYAAGLPQAGAVAAAYGVAMQGALDAGGKFRVSAAMDHAEVDAAGRFGGIKSSADWVPVVLGETVSFDTGIVWQAGEGLTLTRADVTTALARLSASGRIDPAGDAISMKYTATVNDIAHLSPLAGMPLAGNAQISGTAQGAVAAPVIKARADFGSLAIDGERLGDIAAVMDATIRDTALKADIRLSGQVRNRKLEGVIALAAAGNDLTVSRLELGLGRNTVTGNARVALDGLLVNGALSARLSDLSDLPLDGMAPGLVGAANAEVTLRGGPTQDVDLAVSGRGIGLTGDDMDELLAREVSLALQIRDALGTPAFEGTLGVTNARAAGGLLTRADIGLNGTLAGFGWTASAAGTFGVPVTVAAAGTTAVAAGGGTMEVQRLDGTIEDYPYSLRSAARVQWQADTVTTGPIALLLDKGQVELALALKPQSVEASGSIAGLPVAVAALLNPHLDLEGTISGSLSATGNRQQPDLVLSLAADGIRPRDVPLADFAGLKIAVDVQQNDGGLRAGLEVTGPEETRIAANIQTAALLSLDAPVSVDAERQPLSGGIEAFGKLTMIDRIIGLGGDRLDGSVSASATIAGTLARPDVRGDLKLSAGAYEGVATGVVLRDVEGHIEFAGSEARVVTLQASDGLGGQMTGSGAVAIADTETTAGELKLVMNRFTVLRRAEAEVVTSGTIGLSGSLAAPALKGALTVDNAEIRIPDRLPDSVAELTVVEINRPEGDGARPAPPADPSLSQALAIVLDLSIDFPGRSFVRGRGLDSEWNGKLHVGGTSVDPLVTGKLNVVRGTFAFAGKTFVVKSGTVSLDEGGSLEPEIDVIAEAELSTLLARVRIEGKASKPTITVSSEPSMPQEEVLAQILFGRSTGQLTAVQALQLAQTAASLSGAGGANVVDKIRQALGVDVLNVESNGDSGGATLKAGKYIRENIFLSVSQGTEPGTQQVGVEVEVLPNVSVDIDVGGSESGNVGLNWKYDY